MKLDRGFYPFWFWNDDLKKDEIKWQIKEMADKGIKGFYIHPRQGLKQPYISNNFFEMVDTAIKEAEKYGLVVNLYDEYPYPSGIAGGEVIAGEPRFKATRLWQKSYQVTGGKIRLEFPGGKVLSVKAFPLQNGDFLWKQEIDLRDSVGMVLRENSYIETGLTAYNQKRYFASDPVQVLEADLPVGEYKICVSLQIEINDYKYWNNYVDVLDGEAIDKFINYTHERYWEKYGSMFGDRILTIFTDEIHPEWSAKIPVKFEKEYGYSLIDNLPALYEKTHPDHLKVKYDFYHLKYKIFCSSFEEKISTWCNNHRLLYAGEKPSLRQAQLKYMDVPGCDLGHIKAGDNMNFLQGDIRSNAKATASAAYFYEKQGSLCECFHSIGWSANLQDAKIITEELLLLGIDYLVPHGFFYSTHNLKKHDAPPSFFFQMPYWPLFSKLTERINNISHYLENTYLDTEVLVIEPSAGIPEKEDLNIYENIQKVLMENHIGFHIVDSDIIQNGKIKKGYLEIKDLKIKLIVVPPMQVIEKDLDNILNNFQQEGGRVIFCDREIKDKDFIMNVKEVVSPGLSISKDGQEIKDIHIAKRVVEDTVRWFVLNTDNRKFRAQIEMELEEKKTLKEIEIEDEISWLKYRGDNIYERQIFPFESFILETVNLPSDEIDYNNYPMIRAKINSESKIFIKNKNLLRINEWEISIADDNNYDEAVNVKAQPLSSQLKNSDLKFKPVIKEYFGQKPDLKLPELSLNYKYEFENCYDGPVEIVMEPGSLAGKWEIVINERYEISKEDLDLSATHVRGSLGADITNYIVKGKNKIEIMVQVDNLSEGLINPIYLAGDFGVSLDPVLLKERDEVGEFENYTDNLLPYYSGCIEYISDFQLGEIPDCDYVIIFLDYGKPFYQAAEVSVNNSNFISLPWEPRYFKLPVSELKEGKNLIKTRVYNTLIRSFEGGEFDYNIKAFRSISP